MHLLLILMRSRYVSRDCCGSRDPKTRSRKFEFVWISRGWGLHARLADFGGNWHFYLIFHGIFKGTEQARTLLLHENVVIWRGFRWSEFVRKVKIWETAEFASFECREENWTWQLRVSGKVTHDMLRKWMPFEETFRFIYFVPKNQISSLIIFDQSRSNAYRCYRTRKLH